jgi:cellulose biosynthesis protein BcsQ
VKIAVMNFSGNVGKSTISRHLLLPRIKNAEIISVETINSDESSDHSIKGKQFGKLQEALILKESVIVDIGASNSEDFIRLMKQYKGSYKEFDYFIIQTAPKNKQIRDTISTIDALSEIGVEKEKIRTIFNMIDDDDTINKTFSGLIHYYNETNKFTLITEATIHSNDIYSTIKDNKIDHLVQDETDYKQKIKETNSTDEKVYYAHMIALKRLAIGVKEELDSVFKNLFESEK